MLVIIDNYDSFTYNLVQYFYELGAELKVLRNDEFEMKDIDRLSPSHIVISPGPSRPEDSGLTLSVIERYAERLPILGVCLGHQAICQHFGGKVIKAPAVVHGYTSSIEHDQTGVFSALPSPYEATRYHSLIVEEQSLPDELIANAWTDCPFNGKRLLMGVRHQSLPLHGIQFHPESILTEQGHALLKNFLSI